MTEPLDVALCSGDALIEALPALARLRLAVFRDWPYLYEGSEEYEARYLQTYVRAPGAAVMVAWLDGAAVGASTCLPMSEASGDVQAPFLARGWALGAFFYFGESVLLAACRGRGAGVRFFELREARARQAGARWAVFCAVQRPAEHPLRPAGVSGLEGFWGHRGYTARPDLLCRMAWRDVDQADETEKTLMFWVKALDGGALP